MRVTIEDNFIGFDALEERIRVGIKAGVIDIGEDIKDEAIPITPKLTGALRKSAYVEYDQATRDDTSVEVSFGIMGPGMLPVDYAQDQEFGDERGYRYYTTKGTGPRFLSTAFKNVKPMMLGKIALRIKQVLKI